MNLEHLNDKPISSKNRPQSLINEFINSALYSGLQEPVTSVTQIVDNIHNQVSSDKWHNNLKFMEAPTQAKFGSMDWGAQTLGGAVGMLAPFMLAQSGIGFSLDKLGLNSAYDTTIAKNALALSVRDSAISGAAYGTLFSPTNDANFWQGKAKNAMGSALTFGTLTAGSIGVVKLSDLSLINSDVKSVLSSKIVSGAMGGLPAGIVSSEFDSLVRHHQLANWTEIKQSLADMALIGGVFGAKTALTDAIHTQTLNNLQFAPVNDVSLTPQSDNITAAKVNDSAIVVNLNDLPNDDSPIHIELTPEKYPAFRDGMNLLSTAMQSLQSPDLTERENARQNFINFAQSTDGKSVKLNLIPVAKSLGSYATYLMLDGYNDNKPSQVKIVLPSPDLTAGNAVAFVQAKAAAIKNFQEFQDIANKVTLATTTEQPGAIDALKTFLDNNPQLHDVVKSFATQYRSFALANTIDDYFHHSEQKLASEYHDNLKPQSPVFAKIKAALRGNSLITNSGNASQSENVQSEASHVYDLTTLHPHEIDYVNNEISNLTIDLNSTEKGTQVRSARILTKFIGAMDSSQFKDWYNCVSQNLLHMHLPMGSVLLKPEINEAINNPSDSTIDPKLIQAYLSGGLKTQGNTNIPQIDQFYDENKDNNDLPNWFKLTIAQSFNADTTTTDISPNNDRSIPIANLSDRLTNLSNFIDTFNANPSKTVNILMELESKNSKLVNDILYKAHNPKMGSEYIKLFNLIADNSSNPNDLKYFANALCDNNPSQNPVYKNFNEQIALVIFQKLALEHNFDVQTISQNEKTIHSFFVRQPRFTKPEANLGRSYRPINDPRLTDPNKAFQPRSSSEANNGNITATSIDTTSATSVNPAVSDNGNSVTDNTSNNIAAVKTFKSNPTDNTLIAAQTPETIFDRSTDKEDRRQKSMRGRQKDKARQRNRDLRFED